MFSPHIFLPGCWEDGKEIQGKVSREQKRVMNSELFWVRASGQAEV
jgi:hypothetical protein